MYVFILKFKTENLICNPLILEVEIVYFENIYWTPVAYKEVIMVSKVAYARVVLWEEQANCSNLS